MRGGGRAARIRRCVVGAVTGAMVASSLGLAALPAAATGLPPVANPDSLSLVTGTTAVVSPLANDSDPEGDPLTLVSFVPPDPAAATASQAGNDLAVTAVAGFVGQLTIEYAVSDGLQTSTGLIAVTVTAPPNSHPVAVADSASMYSPAVLRLEPLGNDSDPDGDALSLTDAVVTTPSAGTVAREGNVLVIQSAAGYAGPLEVLYTVTDARGAQAQGTVSITVLGPLPNVAPTAVADTAAVKAGHKVTVDVLANDSDPDGDVLSLIKVSKAKHGTARRSGSSIRYTASKSFRGTVRLTYTIQDARGATAKATLTIKVTRKKPTTSPTPASPTKRTSRASVESALARLGLPVGSANGSYDARTRRALCAWRTIVGRTANRRLPSAAEARAIVAMDQLPSARSSMVTGVTVSVTCQAAFWVGANRQYRRVMAATTGKAGYRTRLGVHRIFRTYHTWRYSTIYPEARMYKPMQFSGGQAMHGSATDALVKTYPASHGCVRMLHRDIDALQAGGVGNGTLVKVMGRW